MISPGGHRLTDVGGLLYLSRHRTLLSPSRPTHCVEGGAFRSANSISAFLRIRRPQSPRLNTFNHQMQASKRTKPAHEGYSLCRCQPICPSSGGLEGRETTLRSSHRYSGKGTGGFIKTVHGRACTDDVRTRSQNTNGSDVSSEKI